MVVRRRHFYRRRRRRRHHHCDLVPETIIKVLEIFINTLLLSLAPETVWHKVIGFIFIWGHFTNTLSYSRMVFLQTTPCVDFYIIKKIIFQSLGA